MEHLNTLRGQNATYLMVQHLGRMVTTALKVSLRNPFHFYTTIGM